RVARDLWSITSGELRHAENHMLLLGRKTAMERVATFLLEMDRRLAKTGMIALPMCRRDIGDYLGLTLETVSRALSELQPQGVLRTAPAGRARPARRPPDHAAQSRAPRRSRGVTPAGLSLRHFFSLSLRCPPVRRAAFCNPKISLIAAARPTRRAAADREWPPAPWRADSRKDFSPPVPRRVRCRPPAYPTRRATAAC